MRAVAAALLAGYGVHLLYTAVALRWRGIGPGPARPGPRPRRAAALRRALRRELDRAGLVDVRTSEVAASVVLLALVGAAGAYVVFGGVVPAVAAALFAATFPVSGIRTRRARRLAAAAEAWPRMLEELRLLTGSVGRSIPQALFEVGRRAPTPLLPAFEAAEREWMLTTDFERTVDLLKERLADPTADAVCETLVVAHEVGGTSLDARLAALVEDRVTEVQGRKDAAAKQAGVRFARRFVLVVPLGMALAGLSIGTGRSAYESTGGQLAVVIGIASVAGCWAWSGRLMRLPAEPRVFAPGRGGDRPGRPVVVAGEAA